MARCWRPSRWRTSCRWEAESDARGDDAKHQQQLASRHAMGSTWVRMNLSEPEQELTVGPGWGFSPQILVVVRIGSRTGLSSSWAPMQRSLTFDSPC